jgi:hypothetical protein
MGTSTRRLVISAGGVLLDTGPIQMLPQAAAKIEKFGFKVHDDHRSGLQNSRGARARWCSPAGKRFVQNGDIRIVHESRN